MASSGPGCTWSAEVSAAAAAVSLSDYLVDGAAFPPLDFPALDQATFSAICAADNVAMPSQPSEATRRRVSELDSDSDEEAAGSRPSGKKPKTDSAAKSKACREKARREKINDRFSELATLIDPGSKDPKSDKPSILADAIKHITQMRVENNQLSQLNKFLEQRVSQLEREKGQQLYQQSLMMQHGGMSMGMMQPGMQMPPNAMQGMGGMQLPPSGMSGMSSMPGPSGFHPQLPTQGLVDPHHHAAVVAAMAAAAAAQANSLQLQAAAAAAAVGLPSHSLLQSPGISPSMTSQPELSSQQQQQQPHLAPQGSQQYASSGMRQDGMATACSLPSSQQTGCGPALGEHVALAAAASSSPSLAAGSTQQPLAHGREGHTGYAGVHGALKDGTAGAAGGVGAAGADAPGLGLPQHPYWMHSMDSRQDSMLRPPAA